MSLIEAAVNVTVGYVLAVGTQIVVFPLFGIQAALREHLTIGWAFVCVSLVRGYLLRRLFERLRIKKRASAKPAQFGNVSAQAAPTIELFDRDRSNRVLILLEYEALAIACALQNASCRMRDTQACCCAW